MKALLFAAGLGSRLRPLTNDRPKALVEVGGRSLLEWNLRRLASYGFDEVVINVHHFAPLMFRFVAENDGFGLKIHFSDESDLLLETGGAIRKAASLLGSEAPFLVHNVDILSNVDLGAVYRHHLESSHMATLVVTHRESTRSLLFDDEMSLKGWRDNRSGALRSAFSGFDPSLCRSYAFAGIHVLSPTVFPLLKGYPEVFSITDLYLNEAPRHAICGYAQEGASVLDVGKPESIAQAEMFLRG